MNALRDAQLRRRSLTGRWVNSASTKLGYTGSLPRRKENGMRQEQVVEVMDDPLAQDLLRSEIRARMARRKRRRVGP
jgi:hypothetical protein